MQHTIESPSTATRLIWLGLGLFFASLTLRVLLADVASVFDLNADHLMTIGALVGAVAAGVWLWRMLFAGKLLTAMGLALAFLGATVYCLVGSAGRADEAAFTKNAAARDVNADRKRAERDQAEAKRRYETALSAEEAECASGTGARCLAKRETTKLRRSDLEVADILLRKAPAEQRENGKLKRAAEIIAHYRGTDPAAAERGLALIWPFIPPAVCELLTIVFLHLGFAVSHSVPRVPPKVPLEPANDTGPEPGSSDRVVSWVREFQKRNGRKPMIPELQKQFRLPKTTAWRRIKAA